MIPPRLYVWAAVVLAVFGLGFLCAWKVQGWRLDKANAKSAAVVAQHEAAVKEAQAEKARAEASAARAVAEAEKRTAEVVTKIRVQTREVVREVPVYVSPAVDAAYPLPDGFVCIHDQAATGQGPVAGGPCDTPDAASDVKVSEAAAVIAENYGACRECCERAEQWRQFYESLRKEWRGP